MAKIIRIKAIIFFIIIMAFIAYCVRHYLENRILGKIIERLTADSRVAEALVTNVEFEPAKNKHYTTIKFLEYDTQQKPLTPQYFTFSENVIQFQAMVIRFDDFYVKTGHPLKGKSAYIFTKAFALTDKGVEVFEINKAQGVPSGYRLGKKENYFEKRLWQRFWEYALNPEGRKRAGIKNAQIEAPGTKFIPGMLYTIRIEHDGGLRIDCSRIPPIFKNEKVRF
jgi:hypothetical protein